MNNKILLVDDEKDIIEFLQYNLEQEGFQVISSNNGEDAIKKLIEMPDLIILDVMMPKFNGFETYKRIREVKGFEQTPIIFLTAKAGEAGEIEGLSLGAHDYIHKPISPKKLIARVKTNIRKTDNFPLKQEQVISIGPLQIDRETYMVKIDGKEKVFPRKEFEVLYYLANHPGRVFGRDILLKDVWGSDVFVVDRTVDVHIRKIREKLEEHSDLIETVKGIGYKFKNFE
jgi:two-component system, OmpR family, alkaline phosphatase synthesis response regulator PhoP